MSLKTILYSLSFSFLVFVWLFTPKITFAVTAPSFPSCSNPNAELIVSYDSGTHGIPGRSTSYSGVDKVYQLSDGNVLQCLCTTDDKGVHTNWWKVSSLTEEELNTLKADGWILIPDGSLWGLEKTTYMAKNIDFLCKSSSGSSSSTSTGIGGGEVQGTSTTRFGQVLGLATTGSLPVIASYLLLSTLFLFVAKLLKK